VQQLKTVSTDCDVPVCRMTIIATWKHASLSCFPGRHRWRPSLRLQAPAAL